jgi:hypothetical protein
MNGGDPAALLDGLVFQIAQMNWRPVAAADCSYMIIRRNNLRRIALRRFVRGYQPDRGVDERDAGEQRRDCGADAAPDGAQPNTLDVVVHKDILLQEITSYFNKSTEIMG